MHRSHSQSVAEDTCVRRRPNSSVSAAPRTTSRAPGPPAPVAARDLAVGELFALAFDAVDPLVLVAAGAGGSVALWDAAGDDGAAAAWLAAQG